MAFHQHQCNQLEFNQLYIRGRSQVDKARIESREFLKKRQKNAVFWKNGVFRT